MFSNASLSYQQNGKCNVCVQMSRLFLFHAIPALQWEFLCSSFGLDIQY